VTTGDDAAERLVDAAWSVLERTGFDGFKVASVIRAAGLSTKTFYRHFESKDALLLALLLDEMARAAAGLRARVAAAPSNAEAVRVWVAGVMRAATRPDLRRRARLFSSLGDVAERFPDEVVAGRRALLDPLVDVLARGREAGEFPLADPEPDAVAIYQLSGGMLRELLDGTAPTDAGTSIAQAQAFALRAVGAR